MGHVARAPLVGGTGRGLRGVVRHEVCHRADEEWRRVTVVAVGPGPRSSPVARAGAGQTIRPSTSTPSGSAQTVAEQGHGEGRRRPWPPARGTGRSSRASPWGDDRDRAPRDEVGGLEQASSASTEPGYDVTPEHQVGVGVPQHEHIDHRDSLQGSRTKVHARSRHLRDLAHLGPRCDASPGDHPVLRRRRLRRVHPAAARDLLISTTSGRRRW